MVVKKRLDRSKEIVPLATVTADWLRGQLDAVQKAMLDKARAFRDASMHTATSYDEFKKLVEAGGFVRCHFTPDRAPTKRRSGRDQGHRPLYSLRLQRRQGHSRQGHLHRAGDHDAGDLRAGVLMRISANISHGHPGADAPGPAILLQLIRRCPFHKGSAGLLRLVSVRRCLQNRP